MNSPRLIETGVSTSVGCKMQLVKYELSSDLYFNMSKKWEIPEDMTEARS